MFVYRAIAFPVIYFLQIEPVNAVIEQATATTVPTDWQQPRNQWEYSNFTNFVIGLAEFITLMVSILTDLAYHEKLLPTLLLRYYEIQCFEQYSQTSHLTKGKISGIDIVPRYWYSNAVDFTKFNSIKASFLKNLQQVNAVLIFSRLIFRFE